MKLKLTMLLGLLVVASLVLSACGGAAATPTAAPTEAPVTEAPTEVATEAPTEPPAAEPAGTLTIWADETRAPILQDLADEVLAAYNLELVVELRTDIRDAFQVAAPLGEGPDIFVEAHDKAGTMVANGLLAPVDLGDKADDFAPTSLEACTFDAVLYCMPYATENLGFFYNTELVPTPPTTWDEVVSMGEALKAEGKVDYIMSVTGTTYDVYPLDTAMGGYIFGKDEQGNYNPQDLGVDSEGMIAATKWLADNVANGNLPADWNNDNNRALFTEGKTPFIMDGPWSLERFRDAGVPYAITNFPDSGAPFAGTQGFFVNAQSENVLLAQAFLNEFIATEETMLKFYEAGQRAPAYLPALEKVDDPDLKAMAEAGAKAQMMPAIPEMGAVWGSWNDGVVLAKDGKQDAETAMTEAATKIRNLIANPLTGMVNVPGSYQAQAGCSADWLPECSATAMTQAEDGTWTSGPFNLTAGDYEAKVALDGTWGTNYGVDGEADGANYTFSLAADGTVSFSYDPATHILTITTE